MSAVVAGSNPAGFAGDVSVVNAGDATAYLDTEHQDDATTGRPLSAGSTVVWQAGVPLWVTAPTPVPLLITDSAGAMFDAGAVAGQILAQGLAGQIAAAINVVGVPLVNRAERVMSETFSLATNTSWSSALLDVSEHRSISLRLSQLNGAHPTVLRGVTLQWLSDPVDQLLIAEDLALAGVDGHDTWWNGPTRAPYLQVLLDGAPTGGGPTSVDLAIIAQHADAAGDRWRFHAIASDPAYGGRRDFFDGTAAGVAAGGSVTFTPDSVSGTATLQAFSYTTTTGGTAWYVYIETLDGKRLGAVVIPTGAPAKDDLRLQLPKAPIRIVVNNGTLLTGGCRVFLSMG